MSAIKIKQSALPSPLLKSKSVSGPISVSTIEKQNIERENTLTPSIISPSPSSSGNILSKLASRKKLLEPNQNDIEEKDNKYTLISLSTNKDKIPVNSPTLSPNLKSPISPISPIKYNNSDHLEAAAVQLELNELRDERDLLLQEKQIWLKNIINDNEKLEKMYKELRDSKAHLMIEIDNVQKEKYRLKCLQISSSEVKFDKYLQFESSLSVTRRHEIPEDKRIIAGEVNDKLIAISLKCRENQQDILEYVTDNFQLVEKYFIDNNYESMDTILNSLNNIVSSSPGNIFAAKAINTSIADATIDALSEQASIECLKRVVDFGLKKSGTAIEFESLVNISDMKSIQSENETLKASLIQMRKQIASLRANFAASEKKNSSSPSKAAVTATKQIIKKDNSINSNDDKIISTPISIPVLSSSQLNLKYDGFSDEKKLLISNITTSMVEKQINLHPLSYGMRVDLLNQVCQEVVFQIRPLLLPCLVANINENKDIIQNLLQDEIKKVNVYMELLALISFSLTYVYERCNLPGNIKEEEIEPIPTKNKSPFQTVSPEIKEQILTSCQELDENTSEEDNNYEESYLHSSLQQNQQNADSLRNFNSFVEESTKVSISSQQSSKNRSQSIVPTSNTSLNNHNVNYDLFEEKTLRPKTVSKKETPRYMQSPKRQSMFI